MSSMSMHRRRRKIFTFRLLEGLKSRQWVHVLGRFRKAALRQRQTLQLLVGRDPFFRSLGSLLRRHWWTASFAGLILGWVGVLRPIGLVDFCQRHQNHIAFNITRGSENLFVDVELCLVDLVKKGTNDSGNAPQFHVSLAGEVSVTILASKATNASTSGSRIAPILQSKL